MIGCLTLPFRLLAFALVVVVLAGGWLYRDRIVEGAKRLASDAPPAETGRPTAAALTRARARLDSLARARADSVVLDADEAASLIGAGLDPRVRDRLDSLEVRLGSGRIDVGGVVETGRLPADLVGPLTLALRDRERISLGGPLTIGTPGRAAWTVDRAGVRNVPLPRDLVPGLVRRALGDAPGSALSVRVPEAVAAVRIEPKGIILYRNARP